MDGAVFVARRRRLGHFSSENSSEKRYYNHVAERRDARAEIAWHFPPVSLKFLAAQGKSPGDGVFDRFAAKEWISLECLFSGRGMTKSSTASFSHFIVWPPSYQMAAVFPSCVCGLSWFEWWRR